MNKTLEEQIRQICTYHSDGGTSGYLLSEQQFQQLFSLFKQQREELKKKVEEAKKVPLKLNLPEGITVPESFIKFFEQSLRNAILFAYNDVLMLLEEGK